MRPFAPKILLTLLFVLFASVTYAQDIVIGVTYVCNGEHIYIEGCNIRDTSDTSMCMVAHPDHLTPTGLNTYTSVSRGDLKKLLPTCQQPSAKEIAAAKAFQQKQQDLYNANVKKAEDQMRAATQPMPAGPGGQPVLPKDPETRALNRCITAGRLPASCTGNSLLGHFTQMLSAVLPADAQQSTTGPVMAGVYQGAGNWRLDFIDEGVLVNCAFLSPDQHSYKLEFKSALPTLVIDTKPRPLVLSLHPDGTITGPGPVTIVGVVASGYSSSTNPNSYSGGYHDQYGTALTNSQAATSASPVYDSAGNRVYGAINAGDQGHTNFATRTATCPALNLSTKGAGVGIQTMQTDLLKTMFGGDKGPPTPPGIRMQGIYAASTGFSVQFFPESAVLGCGPDAARAYPYSVAANGTSAVVRIEAPDHPLTLTLKPDGSLDPGASTPYQVHGRVITGQNSNDDFTFAPYEQTCNLAALTPSKSIPSAGGTAAVTTASATGSVPDNHGGTLSTPNAPLGNATLSITSGLPAQPGTANALAGHPYVLLRDSYPDVVKKAGLSVPAGTSVYKYVATICVNRSPDCARFTEAIKADAASAVRADINGSATFPGVPPGTYYLMISTRYNNQPLYWVQPVHLKPGANSLRLDQSNATIPTN